jgi:2-polyprenyl-3-methyl-5-hydroxy-6-metoxy-1,4-benzoquinol methylase
MNEAQKQFIIALAWYRSRYALFLGLNQNREANEEGIQLFAQKWIGSFKQDFTGVASSLVAQNILYVEASNYDFTAYGMQVKNQIETESPFFKFEYNTYFDAVKTSKAHSVFCERVYGKDLSQHGLINQFELQFLIDKLKESKSTHILDIGCGNGKITEEISVQTGAHCMGIDISDEGIKDAQERCKVDPKLTFNTGNINRLNLSQKFDSILFLDTLYYADSLQETLQQCKFLLHEGGKIYAYFSQWIMEEQYQQNLLAAHTHLAKALAALNANYTTIDLSESGINHWKEKLAVLEEMQEAFAAENHADLWDCRYREAFRYAHWGDHKYSRFFYIIAFEV